MRSLIAVAVVFAFAGYAGAEEKIDTKKLIGKWEPAKPDPKEPKMVLEIKDGGKFTISVTVGDKTEKIEGTYKVDGNKVTVESKIGDKVEKETYTITKLTDTEMVSKDSKGKEETMKRVK
jgi:uncharacterized protein (TIGR03066 family)